MSPTIISRLLRLSLALLLVMSLFHGGGAYAAELDKTTICRPLGWISELGYIAEQEGYFKEQGLTVEFLSTTDGKICQDNLLAGHADFAFVGDGPFSYLGFHEHLLRVVAKVQSNNTVVAVYARKDHGIAQEQNLKGKRVGYLPGTVSYFYLIRLLEKLRLRPTDVHLQSMQPSVIPPALENGLIDAGAIWEPWGDQAMQQMANNGLRLHDSTLYSQSIILVTTTKVIDEKPAVIRKVLKALLQAEHYAEANSDDAIPLVAKAIKIDVGLVKRDWPGVDHSVKLDHNLIDLLSANARYILRDDPNFAGAAMPNYLQFIEPRFLREVAPERVEKGFRNNG